MTRPEPLSAILANYDFNVLGIREETHKGKKAVWWVNTDGGLLVLKKLPMGEERFRFLLAALEHLRCGGVRLAPLVKTKNGTPYVLAEGHCYILSIAVEGRPPNYSLREIPMIVQGLARFHRASEGFKPPEDAKVRLHLGTWAEGYEREIRRVLLYLERGDGSAFSDRVLENLSVCIGMASEALRRLLEGGEYQAWVDRVRETPVLCHQDFAAGNLLITRDGDLCVLDTDSLTIDLPARDIRKILNKVMKKRGGWDAALASKMLGDYDEVSPLSHADRVVVGCDLLFPHLLFGITNKYFQGREKEWSMSKFNDKLDMAIRLENEKRAFVDSLFGRGVE